MRAQRTAIVARALVALLMAALLALPALAQDERQEEVDRLANQIRKNLVTLSNYGVFDFINFGIKRGTSGYTVVLRGYASRPTLKKSAERVVAKMELVEAVENVIEVLPALRMDEDVRLAVYAKIYYHPTLSRYNPNRGSPMFSMGRRARQGISTDPPTGYHPISILVRNGNVTLEGVIDSDMDKQLAGIEANTVSGVFSVTNNLQVLNTSKKKK